MKNILPQLLLALALLTSSPVARVQAEQPAVDLADKVARASGSANWGKVSRIAFTFRVTVDGSEKVAAHHDWDLAGNTDTVTWDGKTVALDLAKTPVTEDEKAAFQRWTNDAYWLLAPLKLKDPGTTLTTSEPVEKDGQKFDVLDLSFGQVGLTPGDKYRFYVHPETSLPAGWDYLPNATTNKYATWEKYQTSGGLTLSTHHQMGNVIIDIDDLQVTAAE